ncbi:LytR C-terminal domain-containing protein [Ruania suaedae]|uniref:LytR C-terminal domain-containing protein n=1 Tax=Ruania suaedae TaxID=2897774 RepID=UPI001E346EDB|nr:LytR C-terminal domain-containing protein [Ruania suaedae]UFU03545.1 LytR C-terminal domain-containing protein [Ruania suaedae]
MSNPDPSYPYDEDEFDALGADRTPAGVHRERVPRWRQALPFLVVLVLAPLLAFVVVQAVSRDTIDPGADPTPSVGTSDEETSGDATEEPVDEPTDGEPTDEETEPAEPTELPADLDQGVAVWVLNGTSEFGVAGESQAVLAEAGWTNVVTGDYAYSLPTTTTIYYRDEDIAAEAEAIGAELGITDLVEDANAAPNGIYVVLRPDQLG